jgi:hypothetical protein
LSELKYKYIFTKDIFHPPQNISWNNVIFKNNIKKEKNEIKVNNNVDLFICLFT